MRQWPTGCLRACDDDHRHLVYGGGEQEVAQSPCASTRGIEACCARNFCARRVLFDADLRRERGLATWRRDIHACVASRRACAAYARALATPSRRRATDA